MLAILDVIQLVQAALGQHPDPPSLLITHGLTGGSAVIASVGIFLRRGWASWSIMAWGIMTAGMLFFLGPVLDEPPEAWSGFRIIGGVVLSFGILAGWYVKKKVNAIGKEV